MSKTHANSWKVTDEFWKRVEKLVPERVGDPRKQYQRSAGAGRPVKPARLVFKATVFPQAASGKHCGLSALAALVRCIANS